MNVRKPLKSKPLVMRTLGLAAAAALLLVLWHLSDRAPNRWSGLRPGDRLRYRVELQTDTQASGAAVLSRLGLRGDWELLVLDRQDGRIQFAASLHVQTLDVGQSSVATSEEQLVRDGLAVPIYFTADRRGAVLEVRPDRQIPSVAETIGRSLISYTQVLLDSGQGSWTREELDQTGPYLAEYKRRTERQLDKRKLRYLERPGTGRPELTVLASSQEIALTDADLLESLTLEETLRASLGNQLALTSTTRLRMRARGPRPGSEGGPGRLALAANRPALKVDAPPVSREVFQRWDRQRAEGQTVDGLLQQMLPAKKAGHTDEVNDLFGRLAAVLRVDATAVTDVGARIAAADPEWKLLVDALAGAGTPAAQSALREILATPPAPSVHRGAVLLSLSLVREPTPESVAAVQALVDDDEVGGQAKLGLGSYASALSEQQPARARKVLSLITQGLERSTGQATLDYLLRPGERWDARGDSGSGTVPFVRDPSSASTRARAAQGSRFGSGPAHRRAHAQGRPRHVRTSAAMAMRDVS